MVMGSNNKKDSKEELNRYLNLSNKLGRVLSSKELKENKFFSKILNRCAREEGYEDFEDFKIKNNLIPKEVISNEEYEQIINYYKKEHKNEIESNNIKHMFLEILPIKINIINNEEVRNINWKKSEGSKIYFIYENIDGYIEILEYNKGNKIKIKYNDKEFMSDSNKLTNCELGIVVGKIHRGFRYNIGDIISNKFSSIRIIKRYEINKINQNGGLKYYNYKCLKCGNEDKLYENNILKGYGCPICSKNKLKQDYRINKYNEVKEYIESLGLELLSKEYNGTHDNLKLKCSCGQVFERTLSTIKGTPSRKGIHKCPKCNGVNILTYDIVKEDLNNHNIELLETEYKNHTKKLKIRHKDCGHEFKRGYTYIKGSNYLCPICNRTGGNRRTTESLKEEINNITNGEYTLLSEYKTMNNIVTLIHNKCGNIFNVTPHNFIDGGNRCPRCSISKGEDFIEKYLIENKIKYETQYTFNDLLGTTKRSRLRFDFAIFTNEKLSYLIEYDGEFHYMNIMGEEILKNQQYRDSKKDNYCIKNNIKLVRIPYWDFDKLEDILNDILLNNNYESKYIINN